MIELVKPMRCEANNYHDISVTKIFVYLLYILPYLKILNMRHNFNYIDMGHLKRPLHVRWT
jgi:hypothetical protein